MRRLARRLEALEDSLNIGQARVKQHRETFKINETLSRMLGEPSMSFDEFVRECESEDNWYPEISSGILKKDVGQLSFYKVTK